MDQVMAYYEKVKDRISLEEFLAVVEEKERFLGGLADKTTAAMLVADDLGVSVDRKKIGDVNPEIANVTVIGKIISCSDARTFSREDGSSGTVANLTLADETGTIRVVLWDSAADLIKVGDIIFGDTIQVSGYVREGSSGLEISVGRGGRLDKVAMAEEVQVKTGHYQINEIKPGMGDIFLAGKILDISDTRTFKRKDGTTGLVRNLTLGDTTGKIRVVVWDNKVESLKNLTPGDTVEISGGYAKKNDFSNRIEINLGNNSSIRKSEKQVQFEEKITPIAEIEIQGSYCVAGYVSGLDEVKEFKRKDGTTGRVANIHISDDSGRIRVSLWDEKSEIIQEIDIGTKLQITDCYAKPGWNDEVELSAGERSTVTLLKK